ncbi:hypothetical protein CKO11_06660 [Rhodobacter sp. TJ_12]|nr:hypothetical protein [Rhodobacter sp. TJ_12]
MAASLIAALCALPAGAEGLRLAVYGADFSAKGPGLALDAIAKRKEDRIEAALEVIASARADILLLTNIDWDFRGETLGALQKRLAGQGLDYPFSYAPQPNTGIETGFDIDGNGRLGTARDAQGYGWFTGQHGMALLSQFPIKAQSARDFSALLWRDLPGNQSAKADLPAGADQVLRLSSTAHWDVPVQTPAGPLHIWAYAATPPVFDGPEDRNGRRNADETRFWLRYLDGNLPQRPAAAPFVLMGLVNLDPDRGEGQRAAVQTLLLDPRLQDPAPTGPGAPVAHPTATADFGGTIGPLRVDYILPAAELTVSGAGVIWSKGAQNAGKHRLVWVDLALP